MSTQEMRSDNHERREPECETESSGATLEPIREAGSALLSAGAEAINRALSGNSRAFLEATRQQGGQ
jgi:hypothetical protein